MKRILALGLMMMMASMTQAATLKIATIAPDGTNWMKEMKKAAKEIKAETNGRVKIKFFPGGVQGSDKSVLRKMKIGQLQGGAVSAGALGHITNMVQLYSLPFTFKDDAEVAMIREEFDHYLIDGLKEKGYEVLGLTGGGFAYIMGNKPLKAPADFQGSKLWAPEGDTVTQTVFKNGGVDPVVLPISDVYTSLQTGLIDTVGVNMTASIALQWHTKLATVTDFPILYLMGLLIVDEKAFRKISPEDQAIVKSKMMATYAALDEQNIQDEASAKQALIKSGMQFVTPTEEEKVEWKELADKSMKQLATEDVYPLEVYQQLQTRLETLREAKP
ncbi:MAG: TRAP transporter substrate-binding protein DctP [Oceanobacter sp.]